MAKALCVFLLSVIILSSPVFSSAAFDWMRQNIAIFPEATFKGDYRIFAHTFQSDRWYREAYSNETNFSIALAFLDIKQRFYWMFDGEVRAGFGESPYGMILHPYETSYAIIPTFEYRFGKVHVAAGLDHRCFHYIDQSPPEPVVYWNKLAVAVRSPRCRELPLGTEFIDPANWTGFNRLIWSFDWGYYISEFFGLVATKKLMSVSRPHYVHDFRLTARYGVVRWKWGAALLTGNSLLGFKKDGSAYWSQETGIETLFIMRRFSASLFGNYIFDGAQDGTRLFNSKNRLMEFGLRIIK